MEDITAIVLNALLPYADIDLSVETNVRDAGITSLELMCAIQQLQDEIDCDIADEDFKNIQSVGDIVALFEAAASNRSSSILK